MDMNRQADEVWISGNTAMPCYIGYEYADMAVGDLARRAVSAALHHLMIELRKLYP